MTRHAETTLESLFVDERGDRWVISVGFETMHGRAEPVTLRVDAPAGKALSASTVRKLPLGDLIESARAKSMILASHEVDDLEELDVPFALKQRYERALQGQVRAFRAQRGVALDDETLQAVADTYRAAWGVAPVTEAVADAFHISKSAAAKRIMAARQRGFLGPAAGRKGGELAQEAGDD